jgi:hypothetical protein
LAVMTGGFLMPLFRLKFGIMGYTGKGADPLFLQLGGNLLEFLLLFFDFLGLMGHVLQMGTLKWSYQVGGL